MLKNFGFFSAEINTTQKKTTALHGEYAHYPYSQYVKHNFVEIVLIIEIYRLQKAFLNSKRKTINEQFITKLIKLDVRLIFLLKSI